MMHISTLLPFSVLAVLATKSVLAQDVDSDEIPSACSAICANIVQISDACDTAFESDSDETRCVCNSVNAQLVIPLCAACITAQGNATDNDVSDLVQSCSFTPANYNPDATYSQAQMTAATASSLWSTTTASVTDNPTTTNSFTEIENTPPATASAGGSPTTTIDVASSASAASESAATASPTGAASSNKVQGASALAGAALLIAAAWL